MSNSEHLNPAHEQLREALQPLMTSGVDKVVYSVQGVKGMLFPEAWKMRSDGTVTQAKASQKALATATRLRKASYLPDAGTWFQMTATLTSDGEFTTNLDYDNEPVGVDQPIPLEGYLRELEEFPRDLDHQPDWLKDILEVPEKNTVRKEPEVLPTSPILTQKAINSARTVTYPEELDAERRRNPWPRRLFTLLGFILVAIGIIVVATLVNNASNTPVPGTPDDIILPGPTDSTTGPSTALDLTVVENQWMVVTGSVENTMRLFATQIVEQFGENALAEIELNSSTSEYDEKGVTAPTAMASITPVPADFNVDASMLWFKDNVNQLGSTWAYTEDDEPVEGVTELRRLRLYDTADNPEIPMILDISYFKIAGDEALTISVVSSLYISEVDS